MAGYLHPYNGEQLPRTTGVRCFVRMPSNNTRYMGELDLEQSQGASWLDSKTRF